MTGRIIKFISISILRTFDFLVETFTPNKEVLCDSDIPFLSLLQDNHQVFLQEFINAQSEIKLHNIKDFYKTETDINYDDNWKAVPIILFGHLFKENSERFPGTYKVISQLPGCCAAMFSVLGPGKYIPPHRGIYKGIYRCLFTIQVEQDAECWIRINKRKINFREKESIVFDETVQHEVMNSSTQPRVALYFDFYRKFPFPLNTFNKVIFFLLQRSSFVYTILNEYRKLEDITIDRMGPVQPVLR